MRRKFFALVFVLLTGRAAYAGEKILSLTWDSNPAGQMVDTYSLERSSDTVSWREIARLCSVPASNVLCQNKSALNLMSPDPAALVLTDRITIGSGIYTYRLRAMNAMDVSPPSGWVQLNTSAPSAPGTLRIKMVVDVVP